MKLGISLDEYTSMNNNRYININLHLENIIYNLGLIRIHGSMPADVAVKIVTKVLEGYEIDVERDISGCVTDGASVMKKFGKLLNVIHQLCYAHGIHLGVCDIMYKKK